MRKALFILLLLGLYICQHTASSGSDIDVDVLLKRYSRMTDSYYKNCPLRHTCNKSIGELPDVISGPFRKPCCDTCSCENDCMETYTCCPDKLASFVKTKQEQNPKLKRCSLPALRKGLLGTGHKMIYTCPSHYRNSTMRELCQDAYRKSYLSLSEAAPVTEKYRSKDTYLNIYCALCNGLVEEDVMYWLPSDLRCSTGYFFPESESHLLKHIWKTHCNVHYDPPMDFERDYEKGCTSYISECNYTGLWQKYDGFLEEACHSFTAPYNITYNNIFCQLCNEVHDPIPICEGASGWFAVTTSFSAILNFVSNKDSEASSTGDVENKAGECPEDYIYDEYQVKCLKLHCSYGRIYHNGTCVDSFVGRTFDYSLQANIKLTPQAQFSTEYVTMLTETIYDNVYTFLQAFSNVSYQTAEICETKFYYETDSANNASIINVFFEILVLLNKYPTSVYIEEILNLQGTMMRFGNSSVDFFMELYVPRFEDVMNAYLSRTGNTVILSKRTDSRYCRYATEGEHVTFDISNGMRCPLIELNAREVEWNYVDFGLYINELDLVVSRVDLIQKNNTSVRICADAYIPRTKEYATLQQTTNIQLLSIIPVGYLTFACTMLSVLCLAVTFLTYLLFPNLRKQPGINNMILCLVLLIAQCLFQFCISAKEEVSKWACVSFGILIHFFWLFTIFWMNVCSIHMARVFRSLKSQHLLDINTKRSIIYIVYAFLPSLLLPALNILISYSTTNGHSYGYADNKECYISTTLMLGITFAMPVGFVVATNTILFLFTVSQMCSVPEVARVNQKSRSFLLIYTRLSTITGLAWIFGFIYALTSIVVFDYVFAVLNAGQGVFIMLAFVMNKRIRGMYTMLLCKQKEPLTATTDQSTHAQEFNN